MDNKVFIYKSHNLILNKFGFCILPCMKPQGGCLEFVWFEFVRSRVKMFDIPLWPFMSQAIRNFAYFLPGRCLSSISNQFSVPREISV